jgi:hypothetical protein
VQPHDAAPGGWTHDHDYHADRSNPASSRAASLPDTPPPASPTLAACTGHAASLPPAPNLHYSHRLHAPASSTPARRTHPPRRPQRNPAWPIVPPIDLPWPAAAAATVLTADLDLQPGIDRQTLLDLQPICLSILMNGTLSDVSDVSLQKVTAFAHCTIRRPAAGRRGLRAARAAALALAVRPWPRVGA